MSRSAGTSDAKSVERPDGVAPEVFRNVVGHLASGVTVVTTRLPDGLHGMTASSVTSLSLDPPLMLACLNSSAPTTRAVGEAGVFAVNVLREDLGHLAQQFAVPSDDKFRGVPLVDGPQGSPLLSEALAHIECAVIDQVVAGTHTVFIGQVVHAQAGVGDPLTYFRGGFGRFEFARDDAVYQRARTLVLRRELAVDDVVSVEALAALLEVDPSASFYALTRLAADGLIRRDPARGYVVVPFDARTSDEAFDARCTIELGALQSSLARVTSFQLEELRRRYEQMATFIDGDRFVDFDRYLDANQAFHEGIVRLAGNPLLTAAFRQLSLRSVMARSFGSTPMTSRAFVDSQRTILEACESGDVAEATRAVEGYTEIAKRRAHEVLERAGGRM